MQNLRHIDTGFNTSYLVTFHIDPQLSGYENEKIPALHRQTLESMAALPGVQAVAATDDPELADRDQGINVTVEGYTPPPEEDTDVEAPSINVGYFHAMQVPLLAGRTFIEDDDATHPPVVIVNESFAKHYFNSPAAAVGRRVAEGAGNHLEYKTIVGVARDTRHRNLRSPAKPTLYTPLKQQTSLDRLYFYLRTATPPEQTFAMVRQAMKQIDPGLAVDSMRTMNDQVETTLSNERMIELLAISFGLLATMLTGVGLYGVLAYSTAQRTREIGIRMALGSSRLGVSRLVVMDVLRLAGVGVVVAVPCSVLLAKLLRSQLFGVSVADPLTLGAAVVLIALVALVAAIVPVQRASSVDPTTALRAE
jgi:predicted permease